MAPGDRARARRWREADFYGVLGLRPSASQDEVKKGFRRVALQCHPDKVPPSARAAATRHFQLIAEAYEVLSDPGLRQEYDRCRATPASVATSATPAAAQSSPPRRTQPRPAAAPAPRPQAGAGDTARGSGAAAGQAWPRCAGCDRRCQQVAMRRCPQCSARICSCCDLCASCIPADLHGGGRSRRQQPWVDPDAPLNFGARRGGTPFPGQFVPEARAQPARAPPRRPAAAAPGTEAAAPPGSRPATAGQEEEPRRQQPANVDTDSESEGDWDYFERRGKAADDREARRVLDILLAMGFDEKDARRALEQNQSAAAAISWLMFQGAELYGAVGRAGNGMYDAAKPAASNLGGALQPAADGMYSAANGLYDAVGRWSEQVQSWARAGSFAGAGAGAEEAKVAPPPPKDLGGVEAPPRGGELQADGPRLLRARLVALGFSEAEALAAARRCSSAEAAVEWIAANPQRAA